MRWHLCGAVAIAATLAASGTALADPDWDLLASCESSGDWHINTGNGFFGGIQFTQQTWEGFGGLQYAPRADLATPWQQIEIGAKVLAVQGPQAWPMCSQQKIPGWWDSAPPAPPAPAPQGRCTIIPADGWDSQGFRSGHDGIDIGAPWGTPIRAAAAGVIMFAGWGDPDGYGAFIEQVSEGGARLQYGHISAWFVSPGQFVQAGQIIGEVGSAGSSTGPHLHFRVHNPGPVDPWQWLNSQLCSQTPVPADPTPPAAGAGTYTVETGDTLSIIAEQHGLTWEVLWDRNPQITDPNLIYPGNTITL